MVPAITLLIRVGIAFLCLNAVVLLFFFLLSSWPDLIKATIYKLNGIEFNTGAFNSNIEKLSIAFDLFIYRISLIFVLMIGWFCAPTFSKFVVDYTLPEMNNSDINFMTFSLSAIVVLCMYWFLESLLGFFSQARFFLFPRFRYDWTFMAVLIFDAIKMLVATLVFFNKQKLVDWFKTNDLLGAGPNPANSINRPEN